MKGNDKRITMIGLMVFIFCCTILYAKGEEKNTYWYVNGEKYYWHYQDDVFAFRNVSKDACELDLDPDIVEYIFHRNESRDKINVIYFKRGATESDKEYIKRQIRFSADYEVDFPVVTLHPELAYSSAAWFVMDDLILVNFEKGSLNNSNFNGLKQKYGLQQINFPDSVTPSHAIHTYIFEYDIEKNWPANAIDLSRAIYLDEKTLVSNVQPNLINAYVEVSDDNTDILSSGESLETVKNEIKYYVVNNFDQSIKVFVDLNNHNIQARIKVYDLFGREVEKHEITSDKTQHTMDISNYVSGHYFSCIETDKGQIIGTQKFQKL